MTSGCPHSRAEFIYRRDGIDYVRCLGCGQIFEAEDHELIRSSEGLGDRDGEAGAGPHPHPVREML
jgi:hypothetical protein